MIKAKNWNDLVGLVSRDGKYELIIEVDHCNGWIKPTAKTSEEFGYYLSTHTFSKDIYIHATYYIVLQSKCKCLS